MDEVKTDWSTATASITEAMIKLASCLEAGKNAWLEVRKNGNQMFPIKKKNPLLDDPFNWTMDYGTVWNDNAINERHYFNGTEEDLTRNWTACYGTDEAIRAYQKDGTVSDYMFTGGICHPVRISDVEEYRKNNGDTGYNARYFATYWKPRDGIGYWAVDDTFDVFTVCYDDGPVDKKENLRRAGKFLLECADKLDG